MKKGYFNILMCALSMGFFVSNVDAANEAAPAMENGQQQAPASAAPTSEAQAAPEAHQSAEAQHAPEHKAEAVTEKAGEAVEAAKEAVVEGAEKAEEAVTGEKSKKKSKKGKKKKGKKKKGKKSHHKGASHVCQPPADVLERLDARNNTKEADTVCDTPAAACPTAPAPEAKEEREDESVE